MEKKPKICILRWEEGQVLPAQLQLESLPGIGPKLAARIVDYRAANGPFQSPEELMNVSGIGEKTYAGLAEQITAGAANQEGIE